MGLLSSNPEHVGQLPSSAPVVVVAGIVPFRWTILPRRILWTAVMAQNPLPTSLMPMDSSPCWGFGAATLCAKTASGRTVELGYKPREDFATPTADADPDGGYGQMEVGAVGASLALSSLAAPRYRPAAVASSSAAIRAIGPWLTRAWWDRRTAYDATPRRWLRWVQPLPSRLRGVSPGAPPRAELLDPRSPTCSGMCRDEGDSATNAATPRRWVSTSRGVVAKDSQVTAYPVVHMGTVA